MHLPGRDGHDHSEWPGGGGKDVALWPLGRRCPSGGLVLTWPWAAGATPRPLFEGKDVFDYDAVGAFGTILVAAVLETGPMVAVVSADGAEQRIPVEGVPPHLEAFSPALSVSGEALMLATLAMMNPYLHADGPSTLFYGVLQR